MSLMEAAEAVRQQGRFGDSVLMHVNPQEASALAAQSGGVLTVNPQTGLPEAFLPALLPMVGSVAGGALAGKGMLGAFLAANPYLAGAIGSAIGKSAATGDLEQGLKSGLMTGVTGGLMQGLGPGGDALNLDIEGPTSAQAIQAARAGDTALASDLATVGGDTATRLGITETQAKALQKQVSDAVSGGYYKSVNPDVRSLTSDIQQAKALEAVPDYMQNPVVPAKEPGLIERAFTPPSRPWAHPMSGKLMGGDFDYTGQAIKGIGDELLLAAIDPVVPDVPGKKEVEKFPPASETREEFIPPDDYVAGRDPEFDYFGMPVYSGGSGALYDTYGNNSALYARNGGPIKRGFGGMMSGLLQEGSPAYSELKSLRSDVLGAVPEDISDIVEEGGGMFRSGGIAYPELPSTFKDVRNTVLSGMPGSIQGIIKKIAGRGRDDDEPEIIKGDIAYPSLDEDLLLSPELHSEPVRMAGGGLASLMAAGQPASAPLPGNNNPLASLVNPNEMMAAIPGAPELDEMGNFVSGNNEDDIIVQEAISAARGEHPDPEEALLLFMQRYGKEALDVLIQQVAQEISLEHEGMNQDALIEGDGIVQGIGGGRDDMVQATLDNERDVLLSRDEFVLPADVVSGIGDGSSRAGEEELMALIDRVRTRRTGTKEPPNMVGNVLPA